MLNGIEFKKQLEELFPASRIMADLHADLANEPDENIPVELETGWVTVPKNVTATIISRVLDFDHLETSPRKNPNYGITFRVTLALGGIADEIHNVITPQICFAKLRYNGKPQLVSIDYYAECSDWQLADRLGRMRG